MSIAACTNHLAHVKVHSHSSSVTRSTSSVRPRVTTSSIITWFWFALQLLAVVALQFGDDIFRGNIDPPNATEAIRHAQQVALFEQVHGLFVEPTLQLWARQVHALFGLSLYGAVLASTNVIYALGQTLIPLLFAVWLFRRHRSQFLLVRNIVGLTVLLAVIGYELYPMAPPRLTTGLTYDGHAFSFQDTVQQVIGNGKLTSVPLGYNAYSAMPSLHMATALIISGCIMLLARSLPLRLVAAVYPFVMLFTVLVDSNHYLLDGAGGALIVALATLIALVFEPNQTHLRRVRFEHPLHMSRFGYSSLPSNNTVLRSSSSRAPTGRVDP